MSKFSDSVMGEMKRGATGGEIRSPHSSKDISHSKESNASYEGKKKALAAKSQGHKHGEREARSKKAGFYVHGHKNYGDVYEK